MGISSILKSIFGSKADRDLKSITPYVGQINTFFEQFDKLTHDELRAESQRLKNVIRERIAADEQRIADMKMQLEDPAIDIAKKEEQAGNR